MPRYEVWEPWYMATGMDSPAPARLLGCVEADTFEDACWALAHGKQATWAGVLQPSCSDANDGYADCYARCEEVRRLALERRYR